MVMGRQTVVDKTIRPLTTISSITPAQVIPDAAKAGVIPVGNYKGAAAFWDLDKAVNQPLVDAEWKHILGILDGREEGYDLRTLSIVLNEAALTAHTAALTVPAGQVWYLSTVQMAHPIHAGANSIDGNWRCTLWTDRSATPSTAGQTFHAVAVNPGVGAALLQQDDFWPTAPIVGVANKATMLRAPAGTIFTVTFTNQVAVAGAAINCTFQLFGYVAKLLVA